MRVCLHSDSGAAAREARAGGAEGCQRSDRQLSEGVSTHPYKHIQTHTDRQNTQSCLTAIHTVIFISKNWHKSQNTRGQRSQAQGIVTFPLATHHHSLLSCICTFAIRPRFNLNKNKIFLINCALCLENLILILKSRNQWLEKILAYCAQHIHYTAYCFWKWSSTFPAAAQSISSTLFQMFCVHRNVLFTTVKWWDWQIISVHRIKFVFSLLTIID